MVLFCLFLLAKVLLAEFIHLMKLKADSVQSGALLQLPVSCPSISYARFGRSHPEEHSLKQLSLQALAFFLNIYFLLLFAFPRESREIIMQSEWMLLPFYSKRSLALPLGNFYDSPLYPVCADW